MVAHSGNKQTKVPKYFFLNDKIHMKLRMNTGEDKLWAWDYADQTIKIYSLTDVRRNFKRAWSAREVAEMLNRAHKSLLNLIIDGEISSTVKTEKLHFFTDEQVLKIHEYFTTIHRGRPRKDHGITPHRLPTRLELRSMLNQESILYIKTKSGDFVPTFKANEF